MTNDDLTILTHGGAGSENEFSDGTERAAQAARAALATGMSVLDAVCRAVTVLEDDGRFNAGTGSKRRTGGSLQMDAACMGGDGRYGAVAALEGFKNPILTARAVLETPCRILAGRGAAVFARQQGCEPFPDGSVDPSPGSSAHDTVGCVAFDGDSFAAGLSTGGTGGAPLGRVGDVPLPGCGLYAGPEGAVAATGLGEAIMMNLTAYRAYAMIERGIPPRDILSGVLGWFQPDADMGLILVSRKGFAGGSNRSMAWSAVTGS